MRIPPQSLDLDRQQCCGSGTGSARIQNFLQDPEPELEVMDPDPELDLNLTKKHNKILAI
jgi:hypothetical protein